MSVLITVTQIIFWDCRVHFKFLLFSSDKLSGNNFVKLTAHLQLDIYDNLHSHLIYVFSKSVQVGEEEGSVGGGGGAAQRGTNWYYKIIQIVRALWLAIKPFYMSVCKHGFRSSFISYFIKEI